MKIYKINYKSDFILIIESDAGWAVPFCIKFWTGAPAQSYCVGYDGITYGRCRLDEWPAWVQPTGAQDAYAKDDKVSHIGKHWISNIDANVWEPPVYGWSEA